MYDEARNDTLWWVHAPAIEALIPINCPMLMTFAAHG